MIVITCALPDESRLLLRRMERRENIGPAACGSIDGHAVALVHTGMGEARVRERSARLCAFLKERPARLMLNIGYAGGVNPALPKGQLLLSRNYSSPELLCVAERLLGERAFTGTLVTVGKALETPAAKARFAAEACAPLGTRPDGVDMETAAVATLCRGAGLPMLSLRVISDTATEELAVPFSVCFDAALAKPRPGALLAYLARQPSKTGGFLRFVRDMGKVRAGLAGAAVELVKAF